ncbi:hypothetical protein PHJA_002834800 [Phtheirospermum japonicum]|uniref:Uncharacterized protein n=1 Tax=Phtheirospermum japonicum TaxID=374723 RepID=A0A830D2S8_9LAMI|nr:hypothetical protein PHJA_002834800 [Phtheirospermum japonicum]
MDRSAIKPDPSHSNETIRKAKKHVFDKGVFISREKIEVEGRTTLNKAPQIMQPYIVLYSSVTLSIFSKQAQFKFLATRVIL